MMIRPKTHTIEEIEEMIDKTLAKPVKVYQIRSKIMTKHQDLTYKRAVMLNEVEGKPNPHMVLIDCYYETKEAAE